MANIKKYFPPIYDGFFEIDVLSDIQNKQFTDFGKEINNFVMNQFVGTCSIEKLEELERILKIPIKNESVEFRRERILNRLSMSGPYTLPFLRNKLDSIIGKDNYTINMDYGNYTLYVESSAINQEWFNETYITINKVKPANIVFINKPITNKNLVINETIECTKRMYNYKLGSWRLGIYPFSRLGDKEVLKLKDGESISDSLITDLKKCTSEKISYVKLNNYLVIDEFIFKGVKDNRVVVEYTVHKDLGISEITKVDLYDSEGNIKSTLNVYVPIIDGVELKHIIDIREGVVSAIKN